MLSHVKQARSRYFNDQKECSMQRVQSGRDITMKQINDDTDDANRNIRQLPDTINSHKTSADEYTFGDEEKSTVAEIKNLAVRSAVLYFLSCSVVDTRNKYVPFIKLLIIVTMLLFHYPFSL